jgi:predicted RNA-binding Zn-ribbon protein involved in translation (DUF1610 family)
VARRLVDIEVWFCVCDACEHAWASNDRKVPHRCPNCYLRTWDRPSRNPARKAKWRI